MTTCPYCAEQISETERMCPYCHSDVSGPRDWEEPGPAPPRRSSGSNVWIILVAVAGLGGLLLIIPCLIALLLPAVQQAREAARRTQCSNNLKQIGLALHNYHDVYGCLPPAYVTDEDGRPMYSWRVLILPFLGYDYLHDMYEFSEPWDSPANEWLLDSMPPVFACPSHPDSVGGRHTHYAAVFGPDTAFEGAEPVQFQDVTDGLSNTLFVGEVHDADIPWTSPRDVDVSKNPTIGAPGGFGSHHVGGGQFLMGDGSVRFVNENVNPAVLRNLFTRNDGNVVGGF